MEAPSRQKVLERRTGRSLCVEFPIRRCYQGHREIAAAVEVGTEQRTGIYRHYPVIWTCGIGRRRAVRRLAAALRARPPRQLAPSLETMVWSTPVLRGGAGGIS